MTVKRLLTRWAAKTLGALGLIILCATLLPGPLRASGIPLVIGTDADARLVLDKALAVMRERLGMTLARPVQVKVVDGKELDAVVPESPYRGRVIGLHTMRDGRHMVYLMRDKGRDQVFGTMCHELTHGWQAENCPRQEPALQEGLAVWVEYKCLWWDGAYSLANRVHGIADPVYGVGYRYILKLEDAHGEKGVLQQVKKIDRIPPF